MMGLLPRHGEWRTLAALLTGAALFAAALLSVPLRPPILAMLVATPLFGLPWLFVGPRDRMPLRAIVILIGFPFAHFLGISAALLLAMTNHGFPFTSGGWTDSMGVAGAVAGTVGAGSALLFCRLGGLVPPGRAVTLVAGALLLGVTGAVVLYMIDGEQDYLRIDAIWQVVFAFVLAKVLRS